MDGVRDAAPPRCGARGAGNPLAAHLVGAGDLQAVEDGDEDVRGDEQPQEIGAAQEPVLGAEAIDLCRHPQDGHRRLEGGQQGQGNGKKAHAAVGQQEFLHRALPPAAQCIEQPDGR